ncbi:MAG: phage major capsid protein [Rhodospirillaceae bacterium]|nr:phage major capsid protein [Rhodospirillaceae bacterium]
MPKTLAETLHEKRQKLVREAQELHREIAERGDVPSAEEQARIDRMVAESADLKKSIDAEVQLLKLAETRENLQETVEREQTEVRKERLLENEGGAGDAEDTNAFLRRMATDAEQGIRTRLEVPLKRARGLMMAARENQRPRDIVRERRQIERVYQTTTAGNGGYTIETTVAAMILDFMERIGGVRALGPRVINSAMGNPWSLPRVTAHNTSTGATAENTDASETEDTLNRTLLTPGKYDGLYELTEELLEDTEVDITGFVIDSLGRIIGRKTETAYTAAFENLDALTGAVVAGIPRAHQIAVTAANTAANRNISYANTRRLKFRLDAAYIAMRDALRWAMHPDFYDRALGLLDGDNRPYYKTSSVAGEPDMMEGVPIEYNPMLPADVAASDNMGIMYMVYPPDFFVIRDVGTMEITSSREAEFKKGNTVYRAMMRSVGAQLHTIAGAAIRAANE